MKLPHWLQKIIIPAIALVLGLLVGIGAGNMKLGKAEKVWQEKMKDANKKLAFVQKKMADEKAEATDSLEQQCRSDLAKIRNEKKIVQAQAAKMLEQSQKLELKVQNLEETSAKTKKELVEAMQHTREVEHELKKTATEKQAVQAELKKTTKDLVQCGANNADLVVISQELVAKYKNKGLGSLLLEKEPITQVKKVELEQLSQQYSEEIEQRTIKNKPTEGKHAE
jgi:hypothetical protein